MLTLTIGYKLRKLREEKKMPLRKVATLIDVDVAILSKMERGERRLTKDIVKQLAKLYKHNEEELLILFLSDKVLYEIGDEALALKALKVAEEQLSCSIKFAHFVTLLRMSTLILSWKQYGVLLKRNYLSLKWLLLQYSEMSLSKTAYNSSIASLKSY